MHQKSLKSVNFWESYLKNKKVYVFWDTVYVTMLLRPGPSFGKIQNGGGRHLGYTQTGVFPLPKMGVKNNL